MANPACGSNTSGNLYQTSLTTNGSLYSAANGVLASTAQGSSGIPLIGQGASPPAFGTAVVGGGGTGVTTMTTAYAPVCAGTTATGALQVASTGLATSGYVLTSNGNAALPSFKAATGVNTVVIQVFTSNGTYTPTASMKYCIIEVLGGGGAGGGAAATTAAQNSSGSGGSAGEYARGVFSAATIGASQSVTVGAAGAGSSGAAGGNGGNTSVGALISANGGNGGNTTGAVSASVFSTGVIGGTGGSGGSFRTPGNPSTFALVVIGTFQYPGMGGNSQYGSTSIAIVGSSGTAANATGYGAGGSGSTNSISQSARAGGNGSVGIVIVTEFI